MIKTWRTEDDFVLNKKSKRNVPNLRFLEYWNSASFSRKTSEKHSCQFFLFLSKNYEYFLPYSEIWFNLINSIVFVISNQENYLYLFVELYQYTLFRKIYFGQQLVISALVEHQSQLCFFCFEAGEKGKKVWRESFECIDTLSANWEIPKSTELTFLNTTKLA